MIQYTVRTTVRQLDNVYDNIFTLLIVSACSSSRMSQQDALLLPRKRHASWSETASRNESESWFGSGSESGPTLCNSAETTCHCIGADFHRAMIATARGEKLHKGRRPVRNCNFYFAFCELKLVFVQKITFVHRKTN